MERYYGALRGAVETHGGTVVKLMGDGVMAAFGVPHVAGASADVEGCARAGDALPRRAVERGAQPARCRRGTPDALREGRNEEALRLALGVGTNGRLWKCRIESMMLLHRHYVRVLVDRMTPEAGTIAAVAAARRTADELRQAVDNLGAEAQ